MSKVSVIIVELLSLGLRRLRIHHHLRLEIAHPIGRGESHIGLEGLVSLVDLGPNRHVGLRLKHHIRGKLLLGVKIWTC